MTTTPDAVPRPPRKGQVDRVRNSKQPRVGSRFPEPGTGNREPAPSPRTEMQAQPEQATREVMTCAHTPQPSRRSVRPQSRLFPTGPRTSPADDDRSWSDIPRERTRTLHPTTPQQIAPTRRTTDE